MSTMEWRACWPPGCEVTGNLSWGALVCSHSTDGGLKWYVEARAGSIRRMRDEGLDTPDAAKEAASEWLDKREAEARRKDGTNADQKDL